MGAASALDTQDRSYGVLVNLVASGTHEARHPLAHLVAAELAATGMKVRLEPFVSPQHFIGGKGAGPGELQLIAIGIGFATATALRVPIVLADELAKDLYAALKAGVLKLARHSSGEVRQAAVELTIRCGSDQWILAEIADPDREAKVSALDRVVLPDPPHRPCLWFLRWSGDDHVWVPSAILMDSTQLKTYSYGSNLCWSRLVDHRRLTTAQPVGAAKLTGHRFSFHKRSADGSGKANVELDPSSEVWGAIYLLGLTQRHLLDKAEGLGQGYRIQRTVVTDLTGVEHRVEVYVAEAAWIDSSLRPYDWYKRLVVEGARFHQLPASYIARSILFLP